MRHVVGACLLYLEFVYVCLHAPAHSNGDPAELAKQEKQQSSLSSFLSYRQEEKWAKRFVARTHPLSAAAKTIRTYITGIFYMDLCGASGCVLCVANECCIALKLTEIAEILEGKHLTPLSVEPTWPLGTQVEEMLDTTLDQLDTTPLRSALVEAGQEMQAKFEKCRHRLKVRALFVVFMSKPRASCYDIPSQSAKQVDPERGQSLSYPHWQECVQG